MTTDRETERRAQERRKTTCYGAPTYTGHCTDCGKVHRRGTDRRATHTHGG